MLKKRKNIWFIILAVLLLLAVTLSLPPVWSRVTYHSREVYRTVKYWLKPPNEAVFVPSTSGEKPAATSIPTGSPSASPTPQPTTEPTAITPQATLAASLTPAPAEPATSTPAPTATPVPLPASILLKGFIGERQLMNNCGPATLSINLSYYQWGKSQVEAAEVLKPNESDVNVSPYEVVDFVNQHTAQRAIWRYGGDLQTIKTLLNAGFPVIIEKSFEPYDLRSEGWMGHYNLVVGYDDEKESLTVHDSYLYSHTPWGVEITNEQLSTFIGFDFSYSALEQAWRSFNFVFIVVYPPEKENEVLAVLGPLATEEGAYRSAYERAVQETSNLTEVRDKFFAWFNVGTSLVSLQDYGGAAAAYDTAFSIYPEIHPDSRPYRVMWYETGPYLAYFNAGRYQDVINLADTTLAFMADPVIEESYYWRAASYNAQGNITKALDDLRRSLYCHPGYAPSEALLEQLGVQP